MGLGAELAAEELGHVSGRPVERLGDVHHVGGDRLDTVTLPFHLGDQARHLVPVEGVDHAPVDVESHVGVSPLAIRIPSYSSLLLTANVMSNKRQLIKSCSLLLYL